MLNYWGIFFMFGVMPVAFILLLAVTIFTEKKISILRLNLRRYIKMRAKIIAIWFEKGGGGKTTTAFNLAAGLARKSKKVLLVDVDPTAGSTKHAGLTLNTLQSTLADPLLNVLKNFSPKTEDYLHRVESDPFDILPANAFLDTIEDTVKKVFSGLEVGQALGGVLESLKDKYDYIIIDCAQSTRITKEGKKI